MVTFSFLGPKIHILETEGSSEMQCPQLLTQPNRSSASSPKPGQGYAALWAGTRKERSPVIRLEMMRGRMSIFSILMRMSPGKAINMTTSGWMGDARRSSPPHTAPRMTPGEEGRMESWSQVLSSSGEQFHRLLSLVFLPICPPNGLWTPQHKDPIHGKKYRFPCH